MSHTDQLMTDNEFLAHINKFLDGNGVPKFSEAMKVLGRQANNNTYARYYRLMYINSTGSKKDIENSKLKNKIKSMEDKLNTNHELNGFIRKVMVDLSNSKFDENPRWIEKTSDNKKLVPILMLNDIHMGETVSASEVGVNNTYNSSIAKERVHSIVDDFISISFDNLTAHEYDGCVLPLSGDNITGNLHDLPETNDLTPVQQVQECTELFIQVINKLKLKFDKLFVPCVTGNHSRMAHRRTKTKGRVFDSLETLIYSTLAIHYQDDPTVTIVSSESDYNRFTINGRVFRQEHGDSFRGGQGIGGIMIPIKRGIAKKSQSAVATNQSFDTMMIGHFHTHHVENSVVIGAAPKGYDEYSKSMGFPYEEPGATSFYVNSHGDMIYATHIKCRLEKKSNDSGITIW